MKECLLLFVFIIVTHYSHAQHGTYATESGSSYQLADSMVHSLKEYKEIKNMVQFTKDSFCVKRTFCEPWDRKCKGISGTVIKYEIGAAPRNNPAGYRVDYYVYYSLAEQRVARINDPQAEQKDPESEMMIAFADSIVETLKEYREVQATAEKSLDDRFSVTRIPKDSTDNHGQKLPGNLIRYDIGVYEHGVPAAFQNYYSVYFSIRDRKIAFVQREN